jgi:tRNA dimethylallyltransferase
MIHFVVGPTATGKSQWSLEQAVKVRGIIVNADSLQVFKFMDIGTAKPSNEDRQLVPHHLFDVCYPNERFTAGDYRRAALSVLEDQVKKGYENIFVVGGSGFYLQALEYGMFEAPEISEATKLITQDFVDRGVARQELEKVDPESFLELEANDLYRIRRALEVTLEAKVPLSQLKRDFKPFPFPYPYKKVGFLPDREIIRERVKMRTEKMLQMGLVDEVKNLISMGFEKTKPLESVGYLQCVKFLRGELDRSKLSDEIVMATMQLVKKQTTWFRRDSQIQWMP